MRWMIVAAMLAALAPVPPHARAAEQTPARVSVPEGGALDAETKCLALAVYWEGKAESAEGQAAIAHTVLNRTRSGAFPNTICGVVAQSSENGKRSCQFSWWCDGKRDEPREAEAWKRAVGIARAARAGEGKDPTGGALYFHNGTTRPAWAASKKRLAKIGDHVFYR